MWRRTKRAGRLEIAEHGKVMDTELIERLLGLLERSEVTELEYSENGTRIRIVKSHGKAAVVPFEERDDRETGAPATFSTLAADNSTAASHVGPHRIKAPLSGCFFRAPGPAAPPFVAVGDVVAEGDTLALIEAMKLLNPVEADVAGRVVAALPQDGEVVKMGATLFVIEPAG
jgi:acetyl-CoA carboxylase biotin carboxyl carrier protein